MSKPKPAIITFYSYKGGVGRSMALANVAWLLASKYGKRVLIVDWDLEAPGLHRFFGIEPDRIKLGLIDLFDEYKDLLKGDAESVPPKLVDIEKCLIDVPLTRGSTKGSLSVLAAGRQDQAYATRVNQFDWDEFYEKWHGYGFFEFLKSEFKERAEVTLLDSRTGVTDIGGICTLQLPDVVVLLFALNEQNISGIEFIAENIQNKATDFSEREKPPTLIIRPSRVEKYLEQDKKNEWEEKAATRLAKYLPLEGQRNPLKFIKQNAIPYIGAYSFGETPLAVEVMRDDEPAISFDALAVSVLEASGLWEQATPTMLSQTSMTGERGVFICYSHEDEEWKDRLATHFAAIKEQGLVTSLNDLQVGAGARWFDELQSMVNYAEVAILLISPNTLTSTFLLREEVTRLFQRRISEGLRIFPIIIKPCDWQSVEWLKRMQLRPEDGKPLSAGNKQQIEMALNAISKEILLLLKPQEYTATQPAPLRSSLAAPAVSIGRLPVTGRNLFGRDEQLARLDTAWNDGDTNVLSLVAWDGVGKSALVNHWLARVARDGFRGATRVYGWSFYSQGTTDHAASADQFIEAALVFFGDPDPNRGSPWDKGERLARLVGRERALLVLDGLEPLQHPPGPDEGRLKDQALQSLLRSLAAASNGLCVITTRVAVRDLAPFEGTTHTRIDLETLSPEAGAQLLRAQGTTGGEDELRRASEEFSGHSLSLELLGSYLRDVYGGDIRRRGEIKDYEGEMIYGGHAQKVMASYERWFGEGPELSVLRLLGLFNRPADRGSVDVLRAAPAIPDLTEPLQSQSEPDWQRTLSKLRRARLLAEPTAAAPGMLDTHPLVREHFGQQLKHTSPGAWREGNNRLYEHLRNSTKEFPDTLEEMAPLYAAIAHGCEAGRHQEALDLYWHRVQRDTNAFSIRKLGAIGAELSVLRGFFDSPWRLPVSGLNETGKMLVLSSAGFALRASGRLVEATQPMQVVLESFISRKDLKNVASSARHLSETYLAIGDLSQALVHARQSVEFAEQSGDSLQQMSAMVALANTLHQAGQLSEAEDAFREAEGVQRKRQPEFPILYSLQGFHYYDLLLDQGKYQEVQTRALQTLAWAMPHGFLLDIALDCLSVGRAYLLQAQREATDNFAEASDYLKRAVDGLRHAGTLHHLPSGLLARAELYRITLDFNRAQTDLDEAEAIAIRGNMGLHEADCHLGYTQLYLARGKREEAKKSWAKAKEMIERMGYHRRDRDVKLMQS